MISVLGAGNWGTAIALTIARNNTEEKIFLWGSNSHSNVLSKVNLAHNVYFTTDLVAVIKNAIYLIIAVPSSGFTDLIKNIQPYIRLNQHKIIWATKGLDNSTNKFFNQIINDLISEELPIAVLSGPSFAKEVIDNLPTAVVMAFNPKYEANFIELIKKINSKNFRIEISHDLIGVQLGGIFKNILAVAIGISDGLSFGANTRAILVTMGLKEILSLSDKLGASSTTLIGLSGIGDIFLTCSETQSRNRSFGMLLAKGLTIKNAQLEIGQAIEALDNISSLYNISKAHGIYMPIVDTIWQILYQQVQLRSALEKLLAGDF